MSSELKKRKIQVTKIESRSDKTSFSTKSIKVTFSKIINVFWQWTIKMHKTTDCKSVLISCDRTLKLWMTSRIESTRTLKILLLIMMRLRNSCFQNSISIANGENVIKTRKRLQDQLEKRKPNLQKIQMTTASTIKELKQAKTNPATHNSNLIKTLKLEHQMMIPRKWILKIRCKLTQNKVFNPKVQRRRKLCSFNRISQKVINEIIFYSKIKIIKN